MRICLVSREVAPFAGGGIGVYVAALARVLAPIAEVTVVTMDHGGARPEPLAGVRYHVVPAPDERLLPYGFGFHHAWSAALLEAIAELYGDEGPDLLEVPDYHAEGFVLLPGPAVAPPRARADPHPGARAHHVGAVRTARRQVAVTREERALCAMERYVLRHADHLLWAGGDILATYERFYGRDALAPAVQVRHPLPAAPPGRGEAGGRCAACTSAGWNGAKGSSTLLWFDVLCGENDGG